MGSKPQGDIGGGALPSAAPPVNPGPSMPAPQPPPMTGQGPQLPQTPWQGPQQPAAPPGGANPGMQMIQHALQMSGQQDPRLAQFLQSPELQMIMKMQRAPGGGSPIVDMLRGLGGGVGGMQGPQVG